MLHGAKLKYEPEPSMQREMRGFSKLPVIKTLGVQLHVANRWCVNHNYTMQKGKTETNKKEKEFYRESLPAEPYGDVLHVSVPGN